MYRIETHNSHIVRPIVRESRNYSPNYAINPILSLQQALGNQLMQRMLQTKIIQAKKASSLVPTIDAAMFLQTAASLGRGQTLSTPIQNFFESRFGTDLSKVRIHTDNKAASLARAIDARAFTSGYDIVFDAGQCSAGTSDGIRLLAHELAHVTRQSRSTGIISRKVNAEPLGRWEKSRKNLVAMWRELVVNSLIDAEKEVSQSGFSELGILYFLDFALENCRQIKDNFADEVDIKEMGRILFALNQINLAVHAFKVSSEGGSNLPSELDSVLATARGVIDFSFEPDIPSKPPAVPVSLGTGDIPESDSAPPDSSTAPPNSSIAPSDSSAAPPVSSATKPPLATVKVRPTTVLIQISKINQWRGLVVEPLTAAASLGSGKSPDWGRVLGKLIEAKDGSSNFEVINLEYMYSFEKDKVINLLSQLDMAISAVEAMKSGIQGLRNFVRSAKESAIAGTPSESEKIDV